MHYRKQVKEEIKGLVIDSCKSVGGEVGSRHNKQDSESSEHRELKVPMMVVYIWPLSLPLLTTRYKGCSHQRILYIGYLPQYQVSTIISTIGREPQAHRVLWKVRTMFSQLCCRSACGSLQPRLSTCLWLWGLKEGGDFLEQALQGLSPVYYFCFMENFAKTNKGT